MATKSSKGKTAQHKNHGSPMNPRKCACGVTVTDAKNLRIAMAVVPTTKPNGHIGYRTVKQRGCSACMSK